MAMLHRRQHPAQKQGCHGINAPRLFEVGNCGVHPLEPTDLTFLGAHGGPSLQSDKEGDYTFLATSATSSRRRWVMLPLLLAVIDDIISGLKPVDIVHKRQVLHGRGPVPSLAEGGWYERGTYAVAPGFAAAWKARRPTGETTESAPVAVQPFNSSARTVVRPAAPIDPPPVRSHLTVSFEKPPEELFTFKPTIWGITINLDEAWRRFRKWLRGRNR
jgi:hypothetical protein